MEHHGRDIFFGLIHAHSVGQAVHRLTDRFGGLMSGSLDLAAAGAHGHTNGSTKGQPGSHAPEEVAVVAAAVHHSEILPVSSHGKKLPCVIILPGTGQISVAKFCVVSYNK